MQTTHVREARDGSTRRRRLFSRERRAKELELVVHLRDERLELQRRLRAVAELVHREREFLAISTEFDASIVSCPGVCSSWKNKKGTHCLEVAELVERRAGADRIARDQERADLLTDLFGRGTSAAEDRRE